MNVAGIANRVRQLEREARRLQLEQPPGAAAGELDPDLMHLIKHANLDELRELCAAVHADQGAGLEEMSEATLALFEQVRQRIAADADEGWKLCGDPKCRRCGAHEMRERMARWERWCEESRSRPSSVTPAVEVLPRGAEEEPAAVVTTPRPALAATEPEMPAAVPGDEESDELDPEIAPILKRQAAERERERGRQERAAERLRERQRRPLPELSSGMRRKTF